MRLSIHVVTNQRHNTLALLLESLRHQTYKEWDLVILDNNKQIKVTQDFVLQSIFARLQFEGHRVHIIDNSTDTGSRDIGRYRNMIVEQDPFAVIDKKDQNRTNEIGVRLDDDSIVEANYLEILANGFNLDKMKYNTIPSEIGIVGGIVPYYFHPQVHAPIPQKFNQISRWFDWTDSCINFYRMLDDKGNDRHWSSTYYESGHIRSCYAYRIDVARKIKWPEWTGYTGFTEETTFCIKAWMLGYKVLINPNAIVWHLAYPIGGGRDLLGTTNEEAVKNMEEIKVNNMARLKKELAEFRQSLNLKECSYP